MTKQNPIKPSLDPNYLSDCHNIAVYVASSDEGTNHYECVKCGEACDYHKTLAKYSKKTEELIRKERIAELEKIPKPSPVIGKYQIRDYIDDRIHELKESNYGGKP